MVASIQLLTSLDGSTLNGLLCEGLWEFLQEETIMLQQCVHFSLELVLIKGHVRDFLLLMTCHHFYNQDKSWTSERPYVCLNF